MNYNKMKDRAYIYVFVSKNENLDITKRLFFVGSCLVTDIQTHVHLHIKDLFFPVESDKSKDIYIKQELGLYKYDIYIYDVVPKDLMLTYHRLYYDILCSENFELKHKLEEIKPEYNEMLKNVDFVKCAYENLREFNSRKLNKGGMTYMEVMINELKVQYIINSEMYLQLNMNSNNYLKQLKAHNRKLKDDYKQLMNLYQEVKEKNAVLSSFNDFLKNPSEYEHTMNDDKV